MRSSVRRLAYMMVTTAYSALVESSRRLGDVKFPEIDQSSIEAATNLLSHISPLLDAVCEAEFQKCVVPVEFRLDFFPDHANDLEQLRSLTRALRFAGDVATFNEDYEAVARYGIVFLDLSNAARRGGLVVDHLLGIGIEGCGVELIRKVRHRFPAVVRRYLIQAISRYEREREPLQDIIGRDAKWEFETDIDNVVPNEFEFIATDCELPIEDQKAIHQLVKDFVALPESEKQVLHRDQDRWSLARTRLLMLDLALRSWMDTSGKFPHSIAALTPEPLSAVPLDPFTNHDFIYRLKGNSFTLYSTGPDRVDSGGHFGSWPAVCVGGYDLCLDAEDYRSECCIVPTRPNRARRLWAWLRPRKDHNRPRP
jgi:hypothetical protein